MLKRDCAHARGYQNANDKCVDCGAYPPPGVEIEHLHQALLKNYIAEQQGGQALAGTSVNVPVGMMAVLRCAAIEMYLEKQYKRSLNDTPIVSLQ